MEGYFSVQVTPLGANLFLLEDRVEGELETLVKEGKDWLSQWFKEVRPWKPSEFEIVTWIKCDGIPFLDWNPEFFLYLVGGMGEYLCANDNTIAYTKIDVAWLLVKTKHSKVLT